MKSKIMSDNFCLFLLPVKASPSKKSRGGGPGGLRRAPTLGGPTPLSQVAGETRGTYHSHFKSTGADGDSGKCEHMRIQHNIQPDGDPADFGMIFL